MTAPIVFQTPAVMFLKIWHWERELTTVQPAPFLIFIIDSRTWIVKHKNIAILASQTPLPAPRGYTSCGVAFCQFLWYPLSRKALSCKCSGHAPSLASHCAASGGSSIFCHPPDDSNVSTWKSKGGFHYGNFEYCYCSARPSGHCHPWHCQNHLDDCPSLFSGYASRKTLYQKIKWQEKWPPL